MTRKRSLTLLGMSVVVAAGVVAPFIWAAAKVKPPTFANDINREKQSVLPTGWRIRPAGQTIALPGDMPLKMVFTPDGKYLLVNTAGHHDHGVNLIDLSTNTLVQHLPVHKNWAGMCMDSEGDDVYLSGGGYVPDFANRLIARGVNPEVAPELTKPVLRLSLKDGKLALSKGIVPDGIDDKGRYISGLARSAEGALFVLDINTDTVYRMAGKPRHVEAKARVGYRPLAIVLSPDGKTLAVSNWGDASVSLLDPMTLLEKQRVKVGSQPGEMAFGSDGRLFVANTGSNTVSVIANGSVLETINTALEANAPIGTMPDAVAVSPDGKRLYVANAGNNNIAVVDITHFNATENRSLSQVQGFIPTGWYPSALAISPDGKKLYIGVGKGMYSRGNVPKANDTRKPSPACSHWNTPTCPPEYIGNILNGAVSVVDIPDTRKLAAYTKQVRENIPVAPTSVVKKQDIEDVTKNAFPNIKHVLYIIKENRTYDQVFGDIPGTNADPSLVMYGEKVTPNHHALAKSTVVLDNLYCSGEVSEDGHEWCNSAYATDFKQKGWLNGYSERGEPNADERLTDSPAGYLWDNCKRHGISYRSYGEYSSFRSSPSSRPVFNGNPRLEGHGSLEWWEMDARKDARDSDYAGVFVNDLKEAEKTGKWPQFMVMSLGEDHTNGLTPGQFSPASCVAANDQGLGLIVDAISHSRFWKETAIFVIEDDAQDGPDHVDAHRTIGLVISPYVKRGVVDSTMYTTNSMIRTIELILGLPPMTQFDAAAMPMYNSFTSKPTLTAFNLLPPKIDLSARNPAVGEGAKQSAKLDFSHYDRADPAILNRILWEDAHPGVPMPVPVRSGIGVR